MKKFALLMFLPLALAACAKPVTRAPKINTATLAQEQQAQQALLQNSGEAQARLTMLPPQEVQARVARVAPGIHQQGQEVCQQMGGSAAACNFPIGIATENQDMVNAWADGKAVYVTPAMVSFTETDRELAMVLAHEYAHNVVGHPQSVAQNAALGGIAGLLADQLAASQGYGTGDMFQQLGMNFAAYRYSVDFEQEADYVGMYILARAGYDVTGTENFWRRFTVYDPGGLYTSRTHPSNPQRAVALQNAAAEIKQKQAAGQTLLPEMRK